MPPKFYPPFIPDDAPDGEKDCWRALEGLPDTYSVIWSWKFRWRQGRREFPGEADFIVVTPENGIIAIEAKAGRMTFRDNAYQQNGDVVNPHEQASRAAYAAYDALVAAGLNYVPTRWAMAFTDTADWSTLPRGVQDHQILFRRSCTPDRIRSAIGEIIENVDVVRGDQGSTMRSHKAIVAALAPAIESRFDAILEITDRSLNTQTLVSVKATNDQVESLALISAEDSASGRHRVVVRGPAGSGKTLLALHHAQTVANADPTSRTLLLSPSGQFQRLLLSTKLDPSKVSIPKNVFVHDAVSLMEWAAHVAGKDVAERVGPIPRKRDKGQTPAEFRATQAAWLTDVATDIPDEHLYDRVIVDEAQDFDEDMFTVLELLADRGGRTGAVVLLADPNQRILDGDPWRAPSGYVPCVLRHNLRNTAEIAQVVARVNPQAYPVAAEWSSGADPEMVAVPAGQSLSEAVVPVVKSLVDKGVSLRDIAVLAAGRPTDRIVDALRKAGLEVAKVTDDAGKVPAITVTGAQDFKGRETRVCVVVLDGRGAFEFAPGAEDDEKIRRFRSQAYVALSRARGHLVVVGSESHLDVLDPERTLRGEAPIEGS